MPHTRYRAFRVTKFPRTAVSLGHEVSSPPRRVFSGDILPWRVSKANVPRGGPRPHGGFRRDPSPRVATHLGLPDPRTILAVHSLRGPVPSADFAQGPKGAKDVVDHLADVGVIQTKAIPRLEVVNDPEVPHPPAIKTLQLPAQEFDVQTATFPVRQRLELTPYPPLRPRRKPSGPKLHLLRGRNSHPRDPGPCTANARTGRLERPA